MEKKLTVFVGKNKKTGKYLGVDEYGEHSDLNEISDVGEFMSNLFWTKKEHESSARKYVDKIHPDYKLVKAEITLSIKEVK